MLKRWRFYWLPDAIAFVMLVMLDFPIGDGQTYLAVEYFAFVTAAMAVFPTLTAIFSPGFRHFSRWCQLIAGIFYLGGLTAYSRELEISLPALYLMVQIFIPRLRMAQRGEDDSITRTILVKTNFSRVFHVESTASLKKEDLWRKPLYTAERALRNWSMRLPKLIFPPVTLALIALNVLLFFVGWGNAPLGVDSVPFPSQAVFPLAMTRQTLETPAEWWRLLSATTFHWGVAHLASNMLFLFWLGRMLEPLLGRRRYMAYYIIGGVVASITAGATLRADDLVAGATGAIFALMGVYFGFLVLHFRVLDIDARKRWVGLIFYLLYAV
jgi:membrane associated rhomboid family serine protease